ncbi:MAG: hypothetical protein ISS33_03185 [Candidatus Omnitrophica bacterium]|nr:hypothetical protein [Candidatus Omnitrophota bacterium]
MGKIVLILVVAVVLVVPRVFAEEKFLEIYTFKRDRVDQEIDGNRGYISGEAPEPAGKPRKTQRTLIGVDIQVGVDNSDIDDAAAAPVRTQKRKAKKRVKKSKNSVSATNKPLKKMEAKNKVLIAEETEDNWIK